MSIIIRILNTPSLRAYIKFDIQSEQIALNINCKMKITFAENKRIRWILKILKKNSVGHICFLPILVYILHYNDL